MFSSRNPDWLVICAKAGMLTVFFFISTCHLNTGKRSKFLSRMFPNLYDFNFSNRLKDFFNKTRLPVAYANIRSTQVA